MYYKSYTIPSKNKNALCLHCKWHEQNKIKSLIAIICMTINRQHKIHGCDMPDWTIMIISVIYLYSFVLCLIMYSKIEKCVCVCFRLTRQCSCSWWRRLWRRLCFTTLTVCYCSHCGELSLLISVIYHHHSHYSHYSIKLNECVLRWQVHNRTDDHRVCLQLLSLRQKDRWDSEQNQVVLQSSDLWQIHSGMLGIISHCE